MGEFAKALFDLGFEAPSRVLEDIANRFDINHEGQISISSFFDFFITSKKGENPHASNPPSRRDGDGFKDGKDGTSRNAKEGQLQHGTIINEKLQKKLVLSSKTLEALHTKVTAIDDRLNDLTRVVEAVANQLRVDYD